MISRIPSSFFFLQTLPFLLAIFVVHPVGLGQDLTFVEPQAESVQSGMLPFEPLFDGWQKPKLLLFFTGFLDGYIEPCGCAGIEQMKGGLGRRHTCLQQLEKQGWDVLPIDAGNLNKGFGQQEELKFHFVIDESYRLMKYQAVGIGSRELQFPTITLAGYFVDAPGIPKRYTAANVGIFDFDTVTPYRIFEKNGIKVGVVSVLGDSLLQEINNKELVTASAAEKLREVLPKLVAEQCSRKVLIVHGTFSETTQLLAAFPDAFDFVLPSSTPAEPPLEPKMLGKTMILEVGEKGRFALAIGLFDDPAMPVRYERVPLDARYAYSPTILELMNVYQSQLKKTGWSGLGIHPIQRPQKSSYSGSRSCTDCHEEAFAAWRPSEHAKAWDSLKEIAQPARNFDPECIACHVVGWNAAELLPYQGGFLSEEETPQFISVGCESCHGAGEDHVRAESGTDTALQESLRQLLRLPVESGAAKKHCLTCHDGDHSPEFDFDAYWEKIKHTTTGI